jgi:hypothetical protein
MNKLAIMQGSGVSTKDVHDFRQTHTIRIAFAEPLSKVGDEGHVQCGVAWLLVIRKKVWEKSCRRRVPNNERLQRSACWRICQGGVAFGKKAKPSTPMDKLMHNDYMTGDGPFARVKDRYAWTSCSAWHGIAAAQCCPLIWHLRRHGARAHLFSRIRINSKLEVGAARQGCLQDPGAPSCCHGAFASSCSVFLTNCIIIQSVP